MSKSPDTLSSSSSNATTSSTSKWSSFFFGGSSRGHSSSPVPTPSSSALFQESFRDREHSQSGSHHRPDEMEAFFSHYWSFLAIFSFDRAKEIAEKGGGRGSGGGGQGGGGSGGGPAGNPWNTIISALVHISQAEKAYLTLAFLAPKGFLRKDSNLKSTLESVKAELKKVTDLSAGMVCGLMSSKHSFQQVAKALLVVVNLRLEMMEFYEKLSLYGSAKNVEVSDLLTDIETILEKFSEQQNSLGETSCILNGIIGSLNWECQTIFNLLKSIHAMQTWAYLPATVSLQLANNNLQDWNDLVQMNSTAFKKSSFYSSTPSQPTLLLWIRKLKGTVISKYTLYFYELLAKHSNSTFDIKNYSTKLPSDYYGRICSFQKKSEALCVCIVLDARGTEFYANGYRVPGRKVEPVEGLDSFPAVVSVPAKPTQYWPSVVMMIGDKSNELNADKGVTVYDSGQSGAQLTYFLQKIDPRMYLVIIYESKKPDKDAHVLKFLQELAIELKGVKIFSHLKSFKA